MTNEGQEGMSLVSTLLGLELQSRILMQLLVLQPGIG